MLKGLTLLIAMFVGGAVGGFIGARETGGTGTVTATRFVLVDQNGAVKGVWGMNARDEQLLYLTPKQGGESVLRMAVLGNYPQLAFCNPNGAFRISLGMNEGEGLLEFKDDLGNLRTILGHAPNHDISLAILDAQGNATFKK